MNLNESFFFEEMRCNHLVTSKVKKVWAVQLNLLELLDDICQRHHIRYFVDYGTLLGAVRHQGFVPWDDDIDISMFRDDYERFKQIAMIEVKEPYCFQSVCSGSPMIWAFSKIRDSRTSAIEFPDIPADEFNQGIFIDIFPLDDAPDEINMKSFVKDMQRELWVSIIQPQLLVEMMNSGSRFACEIDILIDMLKLPVKERMKEFENFNAGIFGRSSKINFITSEICNMWPSKEREWYADVVYLPFENMKVPAPIGYDKILKCQYGDYMKYVKGNTMHNGIYMDPETPYHALLGKRLE